MAWRSVGDPAAAPPPPSAPARVPPVAHSAVHSLDAIPDDAPRSFVERYLFSPLYWPATRGAVVAWWERRRLLFNLLVGAAGLITTGTALTVSLLVNGTTQDHPPLGAIVVYALMANVCYSLGAPIDLLLRKHLGYQAGPVAQAMYRYGLAFSVGLTLLPTPLLLLSGVIRLILR